jgi:FtsH-binding integral membrane protein
MFSKFKLSKNSIGLFNKIAKKGLKEKYGFKEEVSSKPLGWALLGLGVGGLGYLMYNNHKRSADFTKSMIYGGSTVSNDISLQRTKDTLLYFSGSIALTSAMTVLMLRSPTVLRYSYGMAPVLMTIPASMFCLYKMYTLPPAPQNSTTKHLFWLGFNACIAFSLVPIISVSELLVIRDAFLLTSGTFAGLGLVAANSRDDAFLGMSGFLGAGLGGLTAIAIANIFLKSNALFNIWLYGGLALFLGMTMYDMKEVQNRAKRSIYFDPMSQSVGIYLDFVNIFIRLLMILQNRKNNRK